MSKLLIVVPLYKQAALIAGLFGSLAAVAAEIGALDARLLLINDSPDDKDLRRALDAHLPALAGAVPVELLVNPSNLGFIGSCNRALTQARDAGADALLLNSDTLLTPGSLTELCAVAAIDPLTAVVSPRSNNATICNSPTPERFRSLPFEQAWAAHRAIVSRLPRVSYVPTAVGFCLLVRHLVLTEFGLFDPIYGGGYNEENDLIFRANQRGYRALLANHAFVYHIGHSSFSVSEVSPDAREERNRAVLLKRFPEYDGAVQRYFGSPQFLAETLCAGFVPCEDGRLRVLFDGNNLGTYFNGTFEHTRCLIEAFTLGSRDRFAVHLACSAEAYAFHRFDEVEGLTFCAGNEAAMAPFAAVFRVAQPFGIDQLVAMKRLAPISGFMMLDTIAMDCQHLDSHGLEFIWNLMLDTADLIGYNSVFTAAQFRRRFAVPDRIEQFVSLCSTEVGDYMPADNEPSEPSSSDHVLVVGNHYAHKNIDAALDALCDHAGRPPIVVLGVEGKPRDGVVSYAVGDLEQDFVDSLYERARVVLFPSHYEGFGLPALHALARRRPLIARDLPVLQEIRDRTPWAANIHLFSTTTEMVGAALASPAWRPPQTPRHPVQTWSMAADSVEHALERAIERFRFDELRRQLVTLRVCELRQNAASDTDAGGTAIAKHPGARGDGGDPLDLRSAYDGVRSRSLWSRLAARSPWGTRALVVTSLDQDLGREPPASRLRASVSIADETASEAVLLSGLLDWAEILELGGTLRLSVPVRDAAEGSLSPLDPEGLRVWLISSGLYPEQIAVKGGRLVAHSVKVFRWESLLEEPADDRRFLETAYSHILRRRIDPTGAADYGKQLQEGLPRRQLLKTIFCSSERGGYVAHHYPKTSVR